MEFTETEVEVVNEYAKLLLQRKLVHTGEEARTQAFLMWALDFGSVEQLSGVPPRPLQGMEAEVPGGYGFVVAKDRAQALAQEHHAEFLAPGVFLFSTAYLTGENAAVALLPTTDVYRAIAAVATSNAL